MPTIFSHALVATVAGRSWGRRLPARLWIVSAVCAMLPDIDVISFAFGIRYEAMDPAKYQSELEKLVTDLALKTREIRSLEGAK